jgi:hypothetical protein
MEKASLAYWRNPKSLPSEFCPGNGLAELDAEGIIVGGHDRQS